MYETKKETSAELDRMRIEILHQLEENKKVIGAVLAVTIAFSTINVLLLFTILRILWKFI